MLAGAARAPTAAARAASRSGRGSGGGGARRRTHGEDAGSGAGAPRARVRPCDGAPDAWTPSAGGARRAPPPPPPRPRPEHRGRGRPRLRPSLLLAALLAAAGPPLPAQQPDCAGSADTSRPPIPRYPDGLGLPGEPLDLLGDPANPEATYYRRFVSVTFADSASGCLVRVFLARYHATVVDGEPATESYTVALPVAPSRWAELREQIARMAAEPGVLQVQPVRAGPAARSP